LSPPSKKRRTNEDTENRSFHVLTIRISSLHCDPSDVNHAEMLFFGLPMNFGKRDATNEEGKEL